MFGKGFPDSKPTRQFKKDTLLAVGPICLPDPAQYYDSVTAVVTGWGRMESNGTLTEVLREDTVSTMTSQRGGGGAVAVMGQDGRYSQIGVVSRNSYTSLTPLLDWVRTTTWPRGNSLFSIQPHRFL